MKPLPFHYDPHADKAAELELERDAIVRQKKHFRVLADALERGEVPDQTTLNVLALLCRQKADAIEPEAKRGAPTKLHDPGTACFVVHRLRALHGWTYADAVAEVARIHDLKDDRGLKREYGERLAFIEGFFPAINPSD